MTNGKYGSLTYVPPSDESEWSRRVHFLKPLRNVVFVDSADKLASRFRDAAKADGLTPRDIADRSDMDVATVERMLGDGIVPVSDMLSIAMILDLYVAQIPADYFARHAR
ncbi:MAG: hypothetical protein LKI34_04590 [Bifidobacterium tibiigranuli]|jgi:hypothetical protein|uniref:hypothetical protein n=1 Tax=Bifidobacterium tibiigranuli TaxID=2172043 RepID=UPI0026EF3BB4|nr:hypothetical protein [Bifidobacterium tibiigranuli]MCI1673479.1 hypothetical protein [Bifidobacterium tibiigranuli]MCI1712779.1 hypothetical protein [Bifidobacterium tibiigranuli]MCI1834556.1 hypothetical protein [Bifidobacterium tibiigranuli]